MEHPGATLGAHRDVAGISLTEVHYAPGFTMGRHAHAAAYLTLTLHGAYTEQMDGGSRTCEEGTLVFRPAGEPHASRFLGRASRCLRIRLSSEWLSRLTDGLQLPGRSIDAKKGRANWLGLQLYEEFLAKDSASSIGIEGLTLAMLADLTRPPVGRAGRAPGWMQQVLDRIHADFQRPLSLADLAATAGVHPVHLARAFREHQGITVAAYTRRLRFERSLRELAELGTSQRSLAEIAQAAGFADQSHFSRTFKKLTGLTPKAYRDRLGRG
jgi:AraC family transcriptional regulator